MDTDYRRRQLDVNDEDGLLLLQEEFLRAQSNSQPAAKASRIVRKAAETSAAADQPTTPAQHDPATGNAEALTESLLSSHITDCSTPVAEHAAQAATGQPANPVQEETPEAGLAVDADGQQPMCPSIPGILTEVREREVLAAAAPAPPPSAPAFPAAVHRKQSKFALGRRQQQQQQLQQQRPSESISQIAAAAPATAIAGSSTHSTPVAKPITDSDEPPVAAAAAAVRPEAAGIHESNLARLAGMSPDEVEEAQAELAARFSPAALQFLKNRRKQATTSVSQQQETLDSVKSRQQQQQEPKRKVIRGQQQQQQQQQQPFASIDAVQPAGAPPAAATRVGKPAADLKPEGTTAAAAAAAGGIRKGFLSGSTAHRKPSKQHQVQQPISTPAATAAALQQQNHGPAAQQPEQTAACSATPQQQPPAPAAPPPPPAAAAAAAKQVTAEAVPPVARLRFSLDGQVVQLADPSTPPTPDEEVLLRDNISRAAGTVPEGYTLPEIRVLVRSSHAPQRAAGFRLMAAVLRRAQPSVLHLGMDGQLIPQEVLLDQQQQQQREEHEQHIYHSSATSSSSMTGVVWYQVWEYMVIALRAVMLCRIGLDDDNGQVLSAASDALCVLLGRSGSELLIDEVAAATAAVSWPLGLRVSLRRLDQAGAWDQVTGLVKAAAAAAAAQQQQQGFMPAESAGVEADVDTPEDLAAVDPLAGFMATEPLPRIRFLLQNRADSTECVIPLLSVLEAVAASSRAAAEQIVRCKGMTEALMGLLGLPIGRTAAAAAAVGSSKWQQQMMQSSSNAYGGFRVGALHLLRLLCAASPLACQLLRTAGLDSVVQLLLCTSGAAGGPYSSSSSSSSEAEQQLLVLEALRIWRVSVLQGVGLSHMDLMFQHVARLLQPPPAAAAAGSISSTDCQRTDVGITQLQWCLTAEAYQLVDTLLRHALAVSNGAKTLGSEMITPGCAAAIAQEAAAAWLQNPKVLQGVAQGLVSLADCSLPYTVDPNSSSTGFNTADAASRTAAWFRALPGMHPSLLVPQGFAVLAGFGAVVQYLASYWSSLQSVPKQLAAELLSQLAALGLAGSSSENSENSSSSRGCLLDRPETAASSGGSRDSLAAVLLSATTGPPQQQQQQQWLQQLGAAFLQHCVHLLCPCNRFSSSGSSSSGGADRQAMLVDYALGSAAAATLLAVCQLQQQLQQPTQQDHNQHLAAEVALVVVDNMLSWVSTTRKTLVLEPWRLSQYTMRHYQVRLLLKLAKPLLQQQQQQKGLIMHIVDGLLSVLPLLGPGHEAEGLQALQLLFGTEAVQQQPVVGPLLPAAAQAAQQLLQQGGPLAAAAAGIRGDGLSTGEDISNFPYPPRMLTSAITSSSSSSVDEGSEIGDAAAWCEVLLAGYAVTWLSVIAQQSTSDNCSDQQQQRQQQGISSNLKASLPLPLARVYVSEVEGSRLPATPEWLMSEILALPHQATDGSSVVQQQQRVHPVSAALLLALGLETCGNAATTTSSSSTNTNNESGTCSSSSSSGYMKAVRAPWKLEALVNLLYLFNAAELLPDRGAAAAAAAGSSLSWQQPEARWAAAVLSQQYVEGIMHNNCTAAVRTAQDNATAVADHPAIVMHRAQQQQQPMLFPTWAAAAAGSQLVERLVTDLADLSMGDPLFSCHVALLLLPAAGVKLQRAVWGSLAHQACLHLLPKPERCIGGSRAYLGLQQLQTPGGKKNIGEEGINSNTGLSGPGYVAEPFFDINFVGDMAKSLAQGDLRKALKMGSLPACMALHGIAAAALDQNAWKGDVSGSSGDSSSGTAVCSAGMAVNILRGVVRACSVEVLEQLLDAGRTRGLVVQDMSRALVQCAHGDAQLSEKVRQLLTLQQ